MSDTIEGRNAVLEALKAALPLSAVLIGDSSPSDKVLDEIVREARALDVDVQRVPRQELDKASVRGAHQGVVARMAPFTFAELGEVVTACAEKRRALIVALDGVTDPQNLGAIARTVEVAGGDGLLITKRRSAGVGPASFKASAGALAHLPVMRETNLVRSLERFKNEGFWVVGAAHQASESFWDADLPDKMVLVMGSEGSGLSRLTREACDLSVSVPVHGRTESLNVGQATTAIVYEWLRRKGA